jgi:hypothetical protein
MAKKYILPVTDDATADCTSYYQVLYKKAADDWTKATQLTYESPLPTQSMGSPVADTPVIVIKPLMDGQHYNVRVTRFCCDGTYSDVAEADFDT